MRIKCRQLIFLLSLAAVITPLYTFNVCGDRSNPNRRFLSFIVRTLELDDTSASVYVGEVPVPEPAALTTPRTFDPDPEDDDESTVPDLPTTEIAITNAKTAYAEMDIAPVKSLVDKLRSFMEIMGAISEVSAFELRYTMIGRQISVF